MNIGANPDEERRLTVNDRVAAVTLGVLIVGVGFVLVQQLMVTNGTQRTARVPKVVVDAAPTTAIPTLGPPLVSWPMFRGSPAHTGFANVVGPTRDHLNWAVAIDATEGEWPNSVAVSSSGTVYVTSGRGLSAFDQSGTLLWEVRQPHAQGPSLSPDEQTVYFGAGTSFHAVAASDGAARWQLPTGGEVHFGGTVGPDGTLYQGSWDRKLYAISPDGSVKWTFPTAGAISYPPSLGSDGTIYLGGGDAHAGPDGTLYAINPDGTLKWRYDTGQLRVGTPAVLADGTIYAPAAPILIALAPDGTLKWQAGPTVTGAARPSSWLQRLVPTAAATTTSQGSKGDIAGIITPAISMNGLIYSGTSEGIILGLDPITRQTRWTVTTGASPREPGKYGLPAFPIVDRSGVSFFGSIDGTMYAVDRNGRTLWTHRTGGPITEAAPAIDRDGTLYFTSEDGRLYAIGAD